MFSYGDWNKTPSCFHFKVVFMVYIWVCLSYAPHRHRGRFISTLWLISWSPASPLPGGHCRNHMRNIEHKLCSQRFNYLLGKARSPCIITTTTTTTTAYVVKSQAVCYILDRSLFHLNLSKFHKVSLFISILPTRSLRLKFIHLPKAEQWLKCIWLILWVWNVI